MYLWPFSYACSCTSNKNLHSAFQSKLLVHLKLDAKSSKVKEYKYIKSSPLAKEHLKVGKEEWLKQMKKKSPKRVSEWAEICIPFPQNCTANTSLPLISRVVDHGVQQLCDMDSWKLVLANMYVWSALACSNPQCHSEGKWCVYMWIISSFGGEVSPTVDHKLVFYFRWWNFFPPFIRLISNKLLILFCDFIFGVPVAMVVMCVLLEDTQIIESTFHVIVKRFPSRYQAFFSENCTLPNSCLVIKAYRGSLFLKKSLWFSSGFSRMSYFNCFQAASLRALLSTTNWGV